MLRMCDMADPSGHRKTCAIEFLTKKAGNYFRKKTRIIYDCIPNTTLFEDLYSILQNS